MRGRFLPNLYRASLPEHSPEERVASGISEGPLSCGVHGDGPSVVLLHAFPLDRRMWSPQVAALGDRYRLVLPDLPGFGDSPHPPAAPDMDYYARRVLDLLDRLGLEQVVLGGLSMGGYVALAGARLFPERLSALVLAGAHAGPDDPEAREDRDRLIRHVSQEGVSALIGAQMPRLLSERSREDDPRTVAAVERMILSATPAGAVAALTAMRERPDSNPLLGAIAVPTLVVGGELDPLTPPVTVSGLARDLPDGRAAVIPGASHLANLEAPERFNALLQGFLREI